MPDILEQLTKDLEIEHRKVAAINNDIFFSEKRLADLDYFRLKAAAEARIKKIAEFANKSDKHDHVEENIMSGAEALDSSHEVVEAVDRALEVDETFFSRIDHALETMELTHSGSILSVVTSALRLLLTPIRLLIEGRIPSKQEAIRLGLTAIILALAIGAILVFNPITAGILTVVALGMATGRYIQQSTLLQNERLTEFHVNADKIEEQYQNADQRIKVLASQLLNEEQELEKLEKASGIMKPRQQDLDELKEKIANFRTQLDIEKQKYQNLVDRYVLAGYKVYKQRRPMIDANQQLIRGIQVSSSILTIFGSVLVLVALANPITGIAAGVGLGLIMIGVTISLASGIFFTIGDKISQWLHQRSLQKLLDAEKLQTEHSPQPSPANGLTPDTTLDDSHTITDVHGHTSSDILGSLAAGTKQSSQAKINLHDDNDNSLAVPHGSPISPSPSLTASDDDEEGEGEGISPSNHG